MLASNVRAFLFEGQVRAPGEQARRAHKNGAPRKVQTTARRLAEATIRKGAKQGLDSNHTNKRFQQED